MIDIRVAIYLFLNKFKFAAFPNSQIIYLCILVAESRVVAAKETTNTTISVVDNDSDKPICCKRPLLPPIKTERAPDLALLKSQAHGKHKSDCVLTNEIPAIAAIVTWHAQQLWSVPVAVVLAVAPVQAMAM